MLNWGDFEHFNWDRFYFSNAIFGHNGLFSTLSKAASFSVGNAFSTEEAQLQKTLVSIYFSIHHLKNSSTNYFPLTLFQMNKIPSCQKNKASGVQLDASGSAWRMLFDSWQCIILSIRWNSSTDRCGLSEGLWKLEHISVRVIVYITTGQWYGC